MGSHSAGGRYNSSLIANLLHFNGNWYQEWLSVLCCSGTQHTQKYYIHVYPPVTLSGLVLLATASGFLLFSSSQLMEEQQQSVW